MPPELIVCLGLMSLLGIAVLLSLAVLVVRLYFQLTERVYNGTPPDCLETTIDRKWVRAKKLIEKGQELIDNPFAFNRERARPFLEGATVLYEEATELIEAGLDEYTGVLPEENLRQRTADLLEKAVFGSTLAVCLLEGGIEG